MSNSDRNQLLVLPFSALDESRDLGADLTIMSIAELKVDVLN